MELVKTEMLEDKILFCALAWNSSLRFFASLVLFI